MKPSFIYSPLYHCDIGAHVFPMEKFQLVKERLISEGLVGESEFLIPEPASIEELLLVHTKEYIDDLRNLRWTHRTMYSELPLSSEIVNAYFLGAGGTILACYKALDKGIAFNLGGGFHHTFPDHAEGFCYVNDIALGIRKMQTQKKISRAAVIDCDLHQGNGTAVIFKDDPLVFTFSIHQENLYPIKQKSDLDIGLDDFTGDKEYLEHLKGIIPKILDGHKPELVIYQAGADPYEHDQLGNLKITIEGLERRDEMVIGGCLDRNIPICITLGGGYAYNTQDTVQIHLNTAKVAIGKAGEKVLSKN